MRIRSPGLICLIDFSFVVDLLSVAFLLTFSLLNIVQVERIRQAQSELKDQIECLSADLKRIAEEQSCPVDLGTVTVFLSPFVSSIVADRIQDVIPEPDFLPYRSPDLGSQIQQQ
jgi:hypothetical protein